MPKALIARRGSNPARRRLARWVASALLGASLTGCFAPPPPSELAADAARELNLAARFGEMGTAAAHASDAERPEFLKRRAEWGKSLRIVDVELAGFQMDEPDSAKVFVDIAWLRVDELNVRSTRIAQFWRDYRIGGWKLFREKRVQGDLGLFGEPVERAPMRAKDVHFPTKIISE